ncbi:MAG: hypothetical protein ACFCUO_02155 [Rhodospirillales bacterium]
MNLRPLDAEEARLYAALLDLVRDQLATVRKAARRRFDLWGKVWGKGRIRSRNRDIEACLLRIIEHKYATHGDEAFSAILVDLAAIEEHRADWPGVSDDDIACVRQILRNV